MSQYDYTKGYNYDLNTSSLNYDLFDDTMNNTLNTSITGIGVGGAGGGGTYTIGSGAGIGGILTGGGAGQTLTWNGVNTGWTVQPVLNTGWTDAITPTTNPLHVKGDAEIEGDLKVKGKSLSEAIENIEKRLAILHPNKELEERWEQLKALGEQYRELEKDILEKEKIWDILKK